MSSIDFSAMCEDAAERLYLEHHGILGQKWGQRRWQNEDGSLTPAGYEHYGYGSPDGKKEAKKLYKNTKELSKLNQYTRSRMNGIPFYKDPGTSARKTDAEDRVKNSPQMKAVRSKLKGESDAIKNADDETYKLMEDFYQDKKLYEKYLNQAIDIAVKSRLEDLQESGYNPDPKKVREDLEWGYRYDDLDQGDNSSFSLWSESNDRGAKAYREAVQKGVEAEKRFREQAENYISEFTGAYGSMPVSSMLGGTTTLNKYLMKYAME